MTDQTAQKVFVYDTSGTTLGNWAFDATLTGVTGITLDPIGASDDLWLVDATTSRTYRYAHAEGLRSGSATAADSFPLSPGDINPQGIADPPPAQQTNAGTDFWLAFPGNDVINAGAESTNPALYITSAVETEGTVTCAGLSFSATFTVTPGTTTIVPLPPDTSLSSLSDGVLDRGLHVTAGAPVNVMGLNYLITGTDAYLGLPTSILGNDYRTCLAPRQQHGSR